MKNTFNEKEFNIFIDESFEYGEKKFRELRLSHIEKEYLQRRFPNAVITPTSETCNDGKIWYDVHL